MSALDLDAIEARAEAATDGPWWHGSDNVIGYGPWAEYVTVALSTGSTDSVFIAHARTDIPALVAEVRRLRALVGDQS